MKEKFSEEDLIGGGTIFKSVTKKDMEGIKLIIPSTIILQKFESIVDPVFRNLELLIRPLARIMRSLNQVHSCTNQR